MSVELESSSVTAKNTYDEVPYISYPYPQSHPNRLAVIAQLFGMQPKPIDDCRVLELGCASGGNLIPMASTLPGSRFVGVDLSARQIAKGQETIDALGLQNIELRARSITDITAEDGLFDYIICHGVYSWVPAEVRDHILTVCSQNLAPQGVAYVSYNTYPGWRMRGTVRDMMVYHARKYDNPKDRVGHSRALLDFLVKSIPEEKNPYGMFLRSEMELLRDKSDSYLLHEHLEHVNEPVYFYEFEGQASAKNLQYLGETELGVMSLDTFVEGTAQVVGRISENVVEFEQYMDFLRNRMFRQTLLCHAGVQLDRKHPGQRLHGLHVASALRSEDAIDPRSTEETRFQVPGGSVGTRSPLLKAALQILGDRWPSAIPFDDLSRTVQSRIHPETVLASSRRQHDSQALGGAMVDGLSKRYIELHALRPRIAAETEQPLVSALARHQAGSSHIVTNLRHQLVALNDLARQVVRLSNGQRDRDDLLAALAELIDRGELVMNDKDGNLDSAKVKLLLAEALDKCLDKLRQDSLLCEK